MNRQNEVLKLEIDNLREAGHKFIKKEISVGDFKGISGGMGVYAQRGGQDFMIRFRTNSGLMSLDHLELIKNFTEKYEIEDIHFTTRQAIQLHHLKIDDICDVMETALEHGLYTRGGGGNYPRNVAISPMSGVEKEEIFDVTEFALKISEYFMSRITEYKLPRKLKVSMSSSDKDAAGATINDVGFIAAEENGEPYFRMYLAGGLGNNPGISIPYDKKVDPKEILYYIEAMVDLFVAEGDYTNRAKARTRYIPRRMGTVEFLKTYEKHLEKVKLKKNLGLDIEAILSETKKEYSHNLKENLSVVHQRQDGLYTVIIHPLNGQISSADFKKVVKFMKENRNAEARLSMTESIYIRNINEEQTKVLLEITDKFRQKTKIQQSMSCVGIPTCQIGIEQSQTLVKNILEYIQKNNISEEKLPSVYVSGCQNSCGRHQVGDIGFAGGKKRVEDKIEDVFDIYTGGMVSREKTVLGTKLGTMLMSQIPEFIGELGIELEKSHMDYKKYITEEKENFEELVKKYLV
ncbi:nitrite/sulfite reductase [Fusobacterium varium]|uniref:nitrite/sulfite reductase n=1 Tax=Fusobacterium TaxID=848 RepID=UPI0015A04637|nr:nitrite/sulfite reductase [uncultured Fusobacterium sp.]